MIEHVRSVAAVLQGDFTVACLILQRALRGASCRRIGSGLRRRSSRFLAPPGTDPALYGVEFLQGAGDDYAFDDAEDYGVAIER